ncbi:MAG TPA: 5-formyltetrahydrofolate cyclo-ligase [Hymenobacter sp.]
MEEFTKAFLRHTARVRRQALSSAEVDFYSHQLCDQLFAHFPVAEWRWLHLFLPLLKQHEPNTWLIARRIWAEQLPVRLAVPVVQPDGISLRHYELTPDTPLHENRWGIPEPDATVATEVSPTVLRAVLVPLLAIDETGHRVGYGGGFYDRFLAQCGPNTQFIGMSLLDESPLAGIADVQPTDVRLHACLTPSRVWRF